MTRDELIPFAALLREYRRAAGLTQEQLAERAHLSARAISALEQGQNHAPRTDTVALLIEALGLTPEERTRFVAAARAPITAPEHPAHAGDSAAAPAHPHNLPLALTSFVGREQDTAGVRRLLVRQPAEGGYRLVTLTGAGGSGKTRLALQVAVDLVADYDDGVWLVELAPLLDPALLPETVAAVVGVREEQDRPLREALVGALRSRHTLLLLDNCEHQLGACAELLTTLLQACPHLRVLATSRERLRIAGEVTWPVPTLAVPNQATLPSIEDFTRCEAVRLFVDRARALVPDFAVAEGDMPEIARICRRLDGLPLAIELAAAWCTVLSVQQIAARLDDCFRLLTGGARVAVDRQRTLKATMDWSFTLLSQGEQTLFARLSVFVGGFDLEAAEAVCPDQDLAVPVILPLLSGLLDKSLVQKERAPGTPRYRLLEPVRQYAAQVLEHSGDLAAMRRRHRDWCLALARRAETQMWTAEQQDWLARLEHEHDNLRAALDWCVTTEGEAETGLLLARALWQFWLLRGHYGDGRYWLESLLTAAPTDSPQRAEVFLHACALAARQDASAAGALAEQGMAAYLARNDLRGRVKAMHLRGMIAWLQFDYPRACVLFEEALAQAEDADLPDQVALLTHSAGFMRWFQGDFPGARALIETSLQQVQALPAIERLAAMFLQLGWLPVDDQALGPTEMSIEHTLLLLREISAPAASAYILANLGSLARCERDHRRAADLLEESLLRFEQLGDRVGRAQVLGQLGNLARVRGDFGRARALLEDCLALRREIGENRSVAHTLGCLGNLALAEGDALGTNTLFEAGLAAVRQTQDKPATAWVAASHASMVLRSGDLSTARTLYRDLEALFRSYGAGSQGQALSLAGLGLIAKLEHDYAAARSLLSASFALWNKAGDRRSCAALLYHLGASAVLGGDPAAAASCFEESLAHFRDLGDAQGVSLVQAAVR